MPKTRPSSLGITLRFCRLARGWSEEELALAVGVKPVLISRYERGGKTLSRERLEELVAVMDVPPESVDLVLFALEPAVPAESPRSPVDLTQAELGIIRRAALALGLRVAEAVRARLTANIRREKAARAREEAAALWKTLKGLPPRRRRTVIETEARYQTWAVAERLCAESVRAAANRADLALELAALALRVAELAPGPETWRSRLQGYVWAFIANARRVQGDLPGAEEAFLRSDGFWEAGISADPGLLDASRLFDLKASLRRQQERYEEALGLLDQALACSSGEAKGRILVNKAATLTRNGRYEQALEVLRQADSLTQAATEPRLSWLVRSNLALNLWQLERYTEAEALLPRIRELAMDSGNELDLFRVVWLEGRIAAGLGRRDQALLALSQAQRYFSANRIAYDSALASLETGVLYLEQQQTEAVKNLVTEMLWIFKDQGVHPEALAAIRLFCEAARKETATAELARQVAAYLVKARHSPELRFDFEAASLGAATA